MIGVAIECLLYDHMACAFASFPFNAMFAAGQPGARWHTKQSRRLASTIELQRDIVELTEDQTQTETDSRKRQGGTEFYDVSFIAINFILAMAI